MTTQKEVTSEEFWDAVRATTRNVHPFIVGQYPYTSIFEFIDNSARDEFGRITAEFVNGEYPPVERCFLSGAGREGSAA